MGLTIRVNGFDEFDIGYFSFGRFRFALAETKNEELGRLYKQWIMSAMPYSGCEKLTDTEFERMKELLGDLKYFLTCSDCDGSFTPAESRKTYFAIKDLKMDFEISPKYHGQGSFNVLERLKNIFYFSYKNRRKVFFL